MTTCWLQACEERFIEFFADKPETVVELIDDQGMIVKLGEPNRQNFMI
jgi:hypothetical protein